MEVMVYMGFFMLMSAFVIMFLLSEFNSDINRREYMLAGQTAGQIDDNVQFVMMAGPGFWANFSIPTKILSNNYKVRFVSSGWLYVDVFDWDTKNRGDLAIFYPTALSNIRPGWDASEGLVNSYSTYIDSDGLLRHEVVIDASKGWIFLNHTQNLSGSYILVK